MIMNKIVRLLIIIPALLFSMAPTFYGLHLAYGDHHHCRHDCQLGGRSGHPHEGPSLSGSSLHKHDCPLCLVHSAVPQNAAKFKAFSMERAQEAASCLVEAAQERLAGANIDAPCSRGPPGFHFSAVL
ncbi:hypothetical protein Dalk_1550 [Desulfatibacillum aliphaticivorans]|uniref:DUF2946 domain-containing protein n=1 Tax=Desulfatibacillum aliphaticivorans TaxID=218208 RepID=B8FAF2_DESAL|nr:hypothetical protein [Desulfatibacillum aliphaticivorans]ACL03248.1 hypothetical protein Dalk_1550 [Desulfatibacillum aliphaticivorans]